MLPYSSRPKRKTNVSKIICIIIHMDGAMTALFFFCILFPAPPSPLHPTTWHHNTKVSLLLCTSGAQSCSSFPKKSENVPRHRFYVAETSVDRVASRPPALPSLQNPPAQAPTNHARVAGVRRGGRRDVTGLGLRHPLHGGVVRLDDVIDVRLGVHPHAATAACFGKAVFAATCRDDGKSWCILACFCHVRGRTGHKRTATL